MATGAIAGITITGIAAAVPEGICDNQMNSDFSRDEISKIIESTGVKKRHVVSSNQCTSDLCFAAAEALLNDMQVERDSIDLVIFISQTPDYILPATACILQNKLKLKKTISAFDINLGCSGYTYGLVMIAQLLASGAYKRALLLAGDTVSKLVAPDDRSVAFLFGDAGSATLIEADEQKSLWVYDTGTDGAGFDKLRVEAGSFRCPSPPQPQLFMSGADIFTFTLREVPKTIQSVLQEADLKPEQIDFFVLHQANRFMLTHLAKKMGVPLEKVLMSLDTYGNTSVASIPLTLCAHRQLLAPEQRLVCCGFGVGFSWATLVLSLKDNKILDPIVVKEKL